MLCHCSIVPSSWDYCEHLYEYDLGISHVSLLVGLFFSPVHISLYTDFPPLFFPWGSLVHKQPIVSISLGVAKRLLRKWLTGSSYLARDTMLTAGGTKLQGGGYAKKTRLLQSGGCRPPLSQSYTRFLHKEKTSI